MPDVHFKYPRYLRRIQSKSDPPHGDLELSKSIPFEPIVSNKRRVSAPHANRTSLPIPTTVSKVDTASQGPSGAMAEIREDAESKTDDKQEEQKNDENEPPTHVGNGKATVSLSKSRGTRRGRGWLRGRRGRGPSGTLRTPSSTAGTN